MLSFCLGLATIAAMPLAAFAGYLVCPGAQIRYEHGQSTDPLPGHVVWDRSASDCVNLMVRDRLDVTIVSFWPKECKHSVSDKCGINGSDEVCNM